MSKADEMFKDLGYKKENKSILKHILKNISM